MYPWYRDSVAAAAAAGLGGPVGVVGSGFCSTGPGQGGTTIKTESGYSDCMLALDYVQSKVSDARLYPPTFFLPIVRPRFARSSFPESPRESPSDAPDCLGLMFVTLFVAQPSPHPCSVRQMY